MGAVLTAMCHPLQVNAMVDGVVIVSISPAGAVTLNTGQHGGGKQGQFDRTNSKAGYHLTG